MPHFATFVISKEGKRSKIASGTSYGYCVAMAQDAYQSGAKGAWVETDGADDPAVRFKIGDVKGIFQQRS